MTSKEHIKLFLVFTYFLLLTVRNNASQSCPFYDILIIKFFLLFLSLLVHDTSFNSYPKMAHRKPPTFQQEKSPLLWYDRHKKTSGRTQNQIENKIGSTLYRLWQLVFYVAFKYMLFVMKYFQYTENYRKSPTIFDFKLLQYLL